MPNFLNLPDWEVSKVLEHVTGVEGFVAPAVYKIVPDTCPKCGVVGQLYRHGKKLTDFKDAPMRGHPVTVRVDRQRYRCQACLETSLQPLPDMDDQRRMTKRCVSYIEQEALQRPFTEIAGDVGIDEKTVRLIAAERLPLLDSEFPVFAPYVLGIDEVMVGKQLRAIYTDLANRQILDLTESRRKPSVIHWLSHLAERERVQVVCIDMWQPYREAAQAVFGKQVAIVVDKFHVVRMADLGMDTVRKQVGQEQTVRGRRHLMRSRHILLKRKSRLSATEAFTLSGWLNNIPRLQAAYEAKEAFHAIYDLPDRRAAEKALRAWEASLTPELRITFKVLLTAIGNWRNEILAIFDHRVTNAYTEAMNGILKQINRRGRGYTFPVLRARILHGFRSKPPKGFNRCDCCRQEFPVGHVKAKYPMPLDQVARTPGAKLMRLCWDCHQSYISQGFIDHGVPT
jgi:transposase